MTSGDILEAIYAYKDHHYGDLPSQIRVHPEDHRTVLMEFETARMVTREGDDIRTRIAGVPFVYDAKVPIGTIATD